MGVNGGVLCGSVRRVPGMNQDLQMPQHAAPSEFFFFSVDARPTQASFKPLHEFY